jgi:hypothetical protein
MQNRKTQDQLMLFHKQVTWRELPKKTREQTIELFAAMCVEIVTEPPLDIQEQPNERSKD